MTCEHAKVAITYPVEGEWELGQLRLEFQVKCHECGAPLRVLSSTVCGGGRSATLTAIIDGSARGPRRSDVVASIGPRGAE